MLSFQKRSFALLLTLIAVGMPATGSAREWQLNMTEGATSVSQQVYGLHMTILWWCVAIGVVVFGVMFYSMIMHRKSRGAKAANFHESTTLEIVWTIIPFFILIFMAVPATRALKHMYDTDNADLDILVTGYQWKWKYEYLGQDVSFFSNLSKKSQQQVHSENKQKSDDYLLDVDEPMIIPTGKKVRFLVTSHDVIHSWWVPALAVKRDAIPGYVNETWTYVDKPGTYLGQCAELCGKNHGFMPIVVKAVTPEEFDAWLSKKREAAVAIAEAAKQTLTFKELYAKGEEVYTEKCAACHQPNGKGVAGMFPALAGSSIATGEVSGHLNTVLNGVSGTAMQAFGEQLTPVEVASVITYERNAFGNNMGDSVQPIDVVNAQQGGQ